MTSRPFDGWSVPDWASPPSGTRTVETDGGIPVRYPIPDAEWIAGLAGGLEPLGSGAPGPEALRARVEALGTVGRRFLDPSDPLRQAALELLPRTAGLSDAMAEAVLDGMARDWVPERLGRLAREELGDPPTLGRFLPGAGRSVMAVAPRLVVQFLAGSVPGVGATALIRSLLLGAPTLLKPGLGDVVLPVLFANALREVAPRLADRLAVVYWPGGDEGVEPAALARAEVVVAYGNDSAVGSLRRRTPVAARFVAYPHREGVGVVGSDALASGPSATAVASSVARAVALFDQRGCVSTRVVWVEDTGSSVSPGAFARMIADGLGELEGGLPSGPLDRLERSGVHQVRGTAEMLSSGWGNGPDAEDRPFLIHGGDAPWTVFYDPYRAVESSCIGRVVIVRPFRTLQELEERLRPVGPHLQTVGVAGLGDRLEEVAVVLGALGASRVAPFATVPFPSPWWHHDGRGPLRDLVRWVDLEPDGLEDDGA